ncbi:hypothetical protein [Ensifer sp. Root278]|uniref:hypothetical protein n=1 Tax=Ensifer sp. Root278 TaxID=1736509 RepID=UPI00070C96FC|nr:hypothetical protein [Ensifer sp. Root278]KRD56479.1 hypothetical protein ASE60_08440 [Ensifer sp. Root278]
MEASIFWLVLLVAAGAAIYLFQKSRPPKAHQESLPRRQEWGASEKGNPTQVYKGKNVTVFESDGGWKFTIGDPNDRREPYFSEPYETVDIAKTEALRHMNRLPSLHQSLPEQRREERRQKEEEQREEFVSNEPEIIAALAASVDTAANITELRKIERKAETQLRRVDRVVDSIAIYGSDDAIEKALLVQKDARELLEKIRARVVELKGKPKTKNGGPSDS